MVRRVRQVTEQTALKRGRPMLVAIRVPDSVEYCKAMGLDIEHWLAEDLVDMLSVSDYFRLNQWEVSTELGHKYGVPVYPCLSESRITDKEAATVRASVGCYRARAMNAWAAGADGIYMFNAFNPRSPLWRELGDPKTLDPLDKVYVVGVRGARVINSWMENGEQRFLKRPVLSPERPISLKPGEPAGVELRVGEEVRKKGDLSPSVTLRLRVKDLPDASALSVKLNGKPLTLAAKAPQWLESEVDPALVAKGVNRFEFTLAPGGAGKGAIEDLQLWVSYKK